MANYDRRILVPYLQDLCSVECLCAKLQRDVENLKKEEKWLEHQAYTRIEDPRRPHPSAYTKNGDTMADQFVYLLFWCFIPLGIGLWVFSKFQMEALWVYIIIGIVVVLFGTPGIIEVIDSNKSLDNAYKKAIEEYEQKIAENAKARAMKPEWERKCAEKTTERLRTEEVLAETKRLRRDLYGISIIPSRYRNIHAVYYLYDFFRTSRETDLEKVIQTMLLDEIIQRLDKIIAQNEEIIIQQRYQIALQQKNNEMIADSNRKQLEQIARLERNQERQMDYQRMIARNQMVTNFLLEAEYKYLTK